MVNINITSREWEDYLSKQQNCHCEPGSSWLCPSCVTYFRQKFCSHKNVTTRGGYHFAAGEVWDDVQEICDDCGKILG